MKELYELLGWKYGKRRVIQWEFLTQRYVVLSVHERKLSPLRLCVGRE